MLMKDEMLSMASSWVKRRMFLHLAPELSRIFRAFTPTDLERQFVRTAHLPPTIEHSTINPKTLLPLFHSEYENILNGHVSFIT